MKSANTEKTGKNGNEKLSKKTQEYVDATNKYCARNYNPLPVVIEKGEGIFVWDVDGKKYFDMLSAYSALNQGHNHPRIVNAMVEQAKKLSLTSRAFYNNVMPAYLKKLTEMTGLAVAIPMNSGTEATETAVKVIRKYAHDKRGIENPEIIVCDNYFHGRSLTWATNSNDPDQSNGYNPALPGFKRIPYNDLAALENAINKNTAAFFVEPIQGEAGVFIPDKDYIKNVRKICDKHKILLCLDEVQTGLARTGKMFCFQHSGIKPDLITLGKALSGGLYPISAVVGTSEVMSVMTPGSHGSTFGGNPLSSAIAIASLEVLEEEHLDKKAEEIGKYFVEKLKTIKRIDIKEVRGMGLLVAIEFTSHIAHDIAIELSKQNPVGLLAKDTHDTTLRFAPPLIITKEQIDSAFAIIKETIEKF